MSKPPAWSGETGGVAYVARLAALTVLLAGLVALLYPVPAEAHIAGGGGSPTNYRAAVTAIRPAVPTVEVTVGLGGQWVRIVDQGAAQIVVLGAQGEPFLRVSDNQVQVNELSNTAAESGLVQRPPGAVQGVTNPPTELRWVTHSEGDRISWADPRLAMPPEAAGESVSWELPLIVDGRQVTVLGTVDRVPSPATWPWVAALVLLAVGVSALGWMRNWHRPVAAVVAVGVLAFGLHLLGTGFAPQESGPLFVWAGIGAVGGFALLIGVVTVVSTLRRTEAAPDRVIMTGIMVLLLAAMDISVLWNSQLPFAGPAVLDRGLTMLTYAIALGLLVAGARARRSGQTTPEAVRPGTASG